MTLWAESVHAVGAGVSTVLVNVQVVILPLLAFLVLGERVRRTFVLAVPVMLVGVALAGGLIGDPEAVTGVAPVRGTVTALIAAAAYAGYLLFVRLGAGPGQRFTPVAIATVGAAVTSFAVGSFWQGIDLAPGRALPDVARRAGDRRPGRRLGAHRVRAAAPRRPPPAPRSSCCSPWARSCSARWSSPRCPGCSSWSAAPSSSAPWRWRRGSGPRRPPRPTSPIERRPRPPGRDRRGLRARRSSERRVRCTGSHARVLRDGHGAHGHRARAPAERAPRPTAPRRPHRSTGSSGA